MFIKVLIIDDHESMCDSLERKLKDSDDYKAVGRLANAALAELYCKKTKVDLIFMDVFTEGGASGLDAIGVLRSTFPDIKIIAMSGFDEITLARRAEEAGAHAFVYKSQSLDTFAETARLVMRGGTYFPEAKRLPMPKGECLFTPREMQILRFLCKHMTSKEIAAELNISENTVKFHKKNMLGKTGFSNCVDLAFYTISRGWINPLY